MQMGIIFSFPSNSNVFLLNVFRYFKSYHDSYWNRKEKYVLFPFHDTEDIIIIYCPQILICSPPGFKLQLLLLLKLNV